MSITKTEIEAAINEAESAIRPTMPDATPIAVTNGTLMALLDAAKGEGNNIYIGALERAIEAAERSLSDVVR